MRSGWIFTVIIVTSIFARDCLADNGAIAFARPVNQITMDGDFGDWPSSFPWHPINVSTAGPSLQGPADFAASFRVGYDRNALYVAVQVQDELTFAGGKADILSRDGCSIFLDVGHTGEETAPIHYTAFAGRSARSESGLAVSWAYQRSGTRHNYEWRFDLNRIHGQQVELTSGRVVGLDLVICDRDSGKESASVFSFGPFYRKWGSSERLGDILFVSSEEKSGQIQGRLVSVDALTRKSRTVRFQNATLSSPVTVISDAQGEFKVSLPPATTMCLRCPERNPVAFVWQRMRPHHPWKFTSIHQSAGC